MNYVRGVVGLFVGTAATTLVAGCAHTDGLGEDRTVLAVDHRRVEEAPPLTAPPPAYPVVERRPRLSRTVTLGQSNPDATYTEIPAPGPAPQAPAVSVQNNVTVINGTPSYGYGYGYGGYGGYGYGGRSSYGRGRSDGRGSSWTRSPTGWEGPSRTAAPGATPGVGGNWAPPRDFGPRMR